MSKGKPKHSSTKEKHAKQKKKLKINFKILFFRILSLIIIVCCAGYILIWLKETNYNDQLLDTLQDSVIITDDNDTNIISVDFNSLKQTNSDTVRLAYCQ